MNNKPVLCIYHSNCADGFTAAWVVWRYYWAEGRDIELFPADYTNPPPDSVAGRDVVVVDFSYKPDVMERLAQEADSFTWLDHHATAEPVCQVLERAISRDPGKSISYVFSKELSGAGLAAKHFLNEVPPIVEVVQDRDLWQFNLPNTEELSAYIFAHDYDLARWTRINGVLSLSPRRAEAVEQGRILLQKQSKDIRELLRKNARWGRIGEYVVPVVNLPYMMASEAGHLLASVVPAAFAAVYSDSVDLRYYQLRSAPTGVDVSEVAKVFGGGGGHKHAAGFTVPLHVLGMTSNSHHVGSGLRPVHDLLKDKGLI